MCKATDKIERFGYFGCECDEICISGPTDVFNCNLMNLFQKRKVLLSWAERRNEAFGDPMLRILPNGRIISIVEILSTLRALSGLSNAIDTSQFAPQHQMNSIPACSRFRMSSTS